MKLASDKIGHAMAGMGISFAAIIVALSNGVGFGWSCAIGVGAAATIGALKELRDSYDPAHHTVDAFDWLATTLGGLSAAAVVALIRFAALRLMLVLMAVIAVAGCGTSARTQEVRQKDTVEDTSFTGSISVPMATETGFANVPVPFTVNVHRTMGEEEHRDGSRESKLNMPEIGAAITAAINQFAPGLAGLMPKPSGGMNGFDWSMLATAGVAAAGMLQRHRAAEIANVKLKTLKERAAPDA